MPHPHADGQSGEVSQSKKHFWRKTVLQNSPKQLA